jgi:alpha-methylacyl-CoA racemase
MIDADTIGHPLAGVTVVEIAGLGPTPFCGMMLADMGADVVRVDRPAARADGWARSPTLDRGRRVVELDLKSEDDVAALLDLVADADAFIEGFRPGVAERLGIGPAQCLARQPSLVYGRMTGWGQTGPYAHTAGHDITYLATTGVLAAIGRSGGPPVVPLNLLGDFGGGGMLLAFGIVCGLLEARRTGKGRVVDAAIVDGAATLSAMIHGFRAQGEWQDRRGSNLLDSGAPFYDVYECRDGRYIAVGALEARFYRAILEGLGLGDDPALAGDHLDRDTWPTIRERLTTAFAARTRDEWAATFASSDACVAPVLTFAEAEDDAHHRARGILVERDGIVQPAPAPRFSRS